MSSLSEYRQKHGISQRAFAESIGVAQSDISRIENGRTPTLVLAAKVERATEGEVPALSWVDEEVPAARAS